MSACEEPGCGGFTRENKPVCTLHLARLPYVARLLAEIDKGLVQTTASECVECGETFDRAKDSRTAHCPPCHHEREMQRNRARAERRKRAS